MSQFAECMGIRMNVNLNGLSEIDKRVFYMQNLRPIMNRGALFSDGTGNFRIPEEPEKNSTVRLRFRTAVDNVDYVFLCIGDREYPMEKAFLQDTFDFYEYELDVKEEKIDYYFKIVTGYEVCFYDKCGPCDHVTGWYNFSIVPGFHTPEWAKGAVIYQIYTDRFYNGDKSNDVETNEYNYIDEGVTRVEDWYKYPAAMGVREFYGGDLQGVLDKLDYLSKLGIEVIYFNPLFVSPSNHKYDIQDYDNIDPHFGKIVKDGGENLPTGREPNSQATKYITRVTDKENLDASNELFAKLVEEAHKRGIRVILDGVFNHCGSFNKWLDRECIYENSEGYEKGAYIAKESEYHNFFKFYEDRWPYNPTYDGWWGHDTLPKLNYEESEKLYKYILDIGKKWVSPPYNVDGWRLDVAADLGHTEEFNHQFWRDFRNSVKEANPEAIILAEHYGDPAAWLQGDQWDTVMNYDAFMEPITWFLTGMQKHSDERVDSMMGDADIFFSSMRHNMSKFHNPSLHVAMNELSNHDHSRFLTRTNRQVGRTATAGPEAANNGINKGIMKEAVVMQMTWPGAPTIYYGDEAGLCGWTDPDNRRTYPWGKEDLELIEFHRDMIQIHKNNIALKKGSVIALHQQYNALAYARFYGENVIVVVVNNNNIPLDMRVSMRKLGMMSGELLERLMLSMENNYNVGQMDYKIENGELTVEMPAYSAAVFRKKQVSPE